MNREEIREAIDQAQYEVQSPKDTLMRIADDLYEVGAIRKAKSLETIIMRLETWQNTK